MADVAEVIQRDLTWLQKHERLLIATFVILAVLFLGNKYLDKKAADADRQLAVAQADAAQQKATNAKQDASNQQMAAQYQSLLDTLTRQNASLAAKVSDRNAALDKRQQTNATLPLPDLAKRWQDLAGVSGITVAPNGLTVDDATARQTVNTLEKVPVLTANVQDETKIAQNTQKELGSANQLIAGLNTQVTGLKMQITADDKACKLQVDSVKADARKGKRNWFIAGVIVGFFGRGAAHY